MKPVPILHLGCVALWLVQIGADAGEEAEGLKVKVIDTCGLEDPEAGDTVHYTVRACMRNA